MDTACCNSTTGTKDAVIIDTGLLTAWNLCTVTADGKRTGLMQSRLQSAVSADNRRPPR